jgi:hypothetical protein
MYTGQHVEGQIGGRIARTEPRPERDRVHLDVPL